MLPDANDNFLVYFFQLLDANCGIKINTINIKQKLIIQCFIFISCQENDVNDIFGHHFSIEINYCKVQSTLVAFI